MTKSISDNTKKRGRPPTTGTGTLVGVRLLPDILAAVDAFAAEQSSPSRPDAIRTIVQDHLTSLGFIEGEADLAGKRSK